MEHLETRLSKIKIEDKMNEAYLEYAMSVIIGRALPDIRDGLKPVHRRILYAMNDLNLVHNRPYSKSAKVIGEVIANYHPHGDTAIYDTTVRMAQDFSMRYQLIDGQGNFGSVDGDAPAAMRYTEVRLKKISSEILNDLNKNTVDFIANYDGATVEPVVLPTKIPTLLINGSTGIAVGMATNIPPHNLREIVDALLYLIDAKDDATFEGLLEHVTGPDFPTGGTIMGTAGIKSAYATGRGSLKIRSKIHTENITGSTGREALIVTELPYAVNKARLIEKIALLVREKRLTGISDLRDESDRNGMRIVIELKRAEIPEVVEANLLKHTSLQVSYGIIMLAVSKGQPQEMSLSECLKEFLDFRYDVIVRRTKFELNKAEDRAHILEGLKTALDNINDVIELIKTSPDAQTAKTELHRRYQLTSVQSQSVLDMRLQKLTGLEQGKLLAELAELKTKIEELSKILSDDNLIDEIIRTELKEVRTNYGDDRRTEITESSADIDEESLIKVESMVVTVTKEGYIKRTETGAYQTQKRGGKGKIGLTTKEEDVINQMFVALTHDTLLMFTNLGRVYWKKVYRLPVSARTGKGRPLVNILPLQKNESVLTCLPIREYDDSFVVIVTKNGVIKKTSLDQYKNQRSGGTKAIVIDESDELVGVRLCNDDDQIFIATKYGIGLRFPLNQCRAQGRVTRGSRGIRLKIIKGKRDSVVGMEIIKEKHSVLTVSELGFGKKSRLTAYNVGRRGNAGNLNLRITGRNGNVVGIVQVHDTEEIVLITTQGKIIRLNCGQVNNTGRVTQGVKLIGLNAGEAVVTISKIIDIEEDVPTLLGELSAQKNSVSGVSTNTDPTNREDDVAKNNDETE